MIRASIFALLLCAASSAWAAEPLAVGARLVPFVLADQHEREVPVGAETKLVLFARDMDGGDIAEAALAENGATLLQQAGAVFISDISRMPGLITRIFALPAMRRRAYPMVLDRTGEATAAFPAKEDHVTVLRLDDMTLTTIEFVATADALQALLAPAAAPAE